MNKYGQYCPTARAVEILGDRWTLCVKHPGFEIDVLIEADLVALYDVLYGRITFARAIDEERLKIDSTPAFIQAFPKWFAPIPFAKIVRSTPLRNEEIAV